MLVASYEAIKFQRLDLFTVTLKQIGAYIARQQLRDAVSVLINGDGNGNAAPVISATAEGALSYEDLIALYSALDPYSLTTIVASPDMLCKVLNLSEFKNVLGGGFQTTGKVGTPLGAEFIKSSAVPAGTLIGLDKSCALEMVTSGDVSVDYDKLIDRQLERAAITCTAGFAKIFPDSAKVLTV